MVLFICITSGMSGISGLGGDFFGEAFDPEYEDFFDPAYYGDFLNPYQTSQQNAGIVSCVW